MNPVKIMRNTSEDRAAIHPLFCTRVSNKGENDADFDIIPTSKLLNKDLDNSY